MSSLPEDRLARAKLSLDGLSIGDAFGQRFFFAQPSVTPQGMKPGQIPEPPWSHTDDTEMAICIVEVLQRRGRIEQDDLAHTFAKRYMLDPYRGYGRGAQKILTAIYAGEDWCQAAAGAFGGTGSLGNGSAMRVAPLGAYFADDLPALVTEAGKSAVVTHSHPEAIAGAIAVAVAAAFAWNHRGQRSPALIREFLEFVLANTPDSVTRNGIAAAMELPRSSPVELAVKELGNGREVTCPDTVPFCLWCAARHFDCYTDALWTAAAAAGDIDTNCAIIGGIVCLSDETPLPEAWRRARGELVDTEQLRPSRR